MAKLLDERSGLPMIDENHEKNGGSDLAPSGKSALTWEKLTKPKQRELLEAYRRLGIMRDALKETGISKNTHYKWMDEDGLYSEAYNNCRLRRAPILEECAMDRAVNGWDEPVYFKGQVVGHTRKYDNNLLWKLLVNNHPDYSKSLPGGDNNVLVSGELPKVQIVLPHNGRD